MDPELEQIKLSNDSVIDDRIIDSVHTYSDSVQMIQKVAYNVIVNKYLDLSLAEKIVLICLTGYIRGADWSFNLSIDRLYLQVSATKKTVSKAIKSLENKGFIKKGDKTDYFIAREYISNFPSV